MTSDPKYRDRLPAGPFGPGPLILVAAALLFASTARADHIDNELPAQGIKVIRFLKEKGYKNVGVLKFRVRKGNEKENFHAGPINVAMANRLENVLLIANEKVDPPIGIIHEAFKVAAAHKEHASYLSPAGCAKLFKYSYPLVWGSRKVEADAFVTGLVSLSPDLRRAWIRLEAVDRISQKLHKIVEFEVRTDRAILADVCQSFVLNSRRLRTMGGDGPDNEAADNGSERNRGRTAPSNGERLVDVEILYDGKPIQVKQGQGEEVAEEEPGEGQKIEFRVHNKSSQTLGLILAVNGKSTLYEQDLSPMSVAGCNKWVLEPGATYMIQGFYQEGDRAYAPFKILSAEASLAEEEQNPDPRLGRIQIMVFQEGGGPATASTPRRTQGLRSALPVTKARPQTARDAAQLARKTTNARAKAMGLIKAGEELQQANLETGSLRDPTIQENRVIVYRGRGSRPERQEN